MKQAKQTEIYQLKITLKYIRPPIWRRIEVPGDITLDELHLILQAAMGWTNSHLHQFRVGKIYYGKPSIDEFSDLNLKDETKVRLNKILSRPKQKMIYEYDFGDGWEHEILLEKVLTRDSTVRYPRCRGGARARPRIAVEFTGMRIFSKRFLTRSTRSTTSISIGSAANSIPRNSTWLSLKTS